ncbi:MAG: hypothetical protein R2853_12005 [Thermomicrobiales bacterium]
MQSSLKCLDQLEPTPSTISDHGLTPLVLALLVIWIATPLPIGYWLFRRAASPVNARVNRRALVLSSPLTPLFLGSCGGQTETRLPPKISYDRDTCTRCGMIISDERFAAALVAPDGSVQLFDDVGEVFGD